MRKIKFRGRNYLGETFYGAFDESDCTMSCWNLEDGGIVAVERDTVAQLVGCDAYGREVYEGDKLVNPHDGTHFKAAMNHIYTVKIYVKEATT